jgi:hypothetical protein
MSVKYKIRDQHGLNYLTCSVTGWVDLFARQVYRDVVLDSWHYCQAYKGFQVHAFTHHVQSSAFDSELHGSVSAGPFYDITRER